MARLNPQLQPDPQSSKVITCEACFLLAHDSILTFCSMGDSEASGLSAAACPSRMTSVRAAAYRFPSAPQNALLAGSIAPAATTSAATAAAWPASYKSKLPP